MRTTRWGLLLALLMLIAACGGDPAANPTTTTTAPTTTTVASTTTSEATTTTAATTTTTEASAFPVTVELANGELTLEGRPTRIVSLSPTATEMLFAVGAGDQVVAADEFSTYPEEAPDTDLSGFTPNLEAIVSYEPDLVVVANDTDGIVGALGEVGVPVALLPAAATLDDVYAQIETVGVLTGHAEEAADLAADLEAEIAALVEGVDQPAEPLTYFHELDPTFYSATSSTFIGEVYGLFGLENIADPADADGFGYPQLTEEYIIEADPDLIFLADAQCCGITPESVAQRPGWESITAVENGHIFVMDADIASRWGPRIVQYVEDVAAALEEVTG